MLGKIILQDMKIKTDFAASGQAALGLFAPGKYQLVLLDINMPDFDGIEVARRIRQLEKNSDKAQTKIVAMTANAFKNHIRDYFKVGMDDVILKPFTEELLQEKILRNVIPDAAATEFEPELKPKRQPKGQSDFSLQHLAKITKGDTDFMLTMLDTFIENTQMLNKRIRLSLQRNDYNDIAEAAHRLLPSVEQLGMTKAVDLLSKIEAKYLRQSNYQPDQALIDAAIAELEKAVAKISHVKLELVNQK
jgi:CheY-like chemotaxis protein